MKKGNSKKQADIVFILFSMVLGLLMGWIAKDFQGSGVLGAVISNLGIWIFLGALVGAYSGTAFQGALHVFLLYVGVIVAYYVHEIALGGELPVFGQLLTVLLSALIGGLLGFVFWHSKDKEWLGAACAAVPISLLIAEGYPIYYSRSISLGLDIALAVILYILLTPGKNKKLMALPFIIVFTFALVYFDVFSRFLGQFI